MCGNSQGRPALEGSIVDLWRRYRVILVWTRKLHRVYRKKRRFKMRRRMRRRRRRRSKERSKRKLRSRRRLKRRRRRRMEGEKEH